MSDIPRGTYNVVGRLNSPINVHVPRIYKLIKPEADFAWSSILSGRRIAK
jgi:hypothetical protein